MKKFPILSKIKALNDSLNTLLTYTATSTTDFLGQILDYVLSKGAGSITFGATWQSHFFCLVNASAQSSTRCVIQVIPQIGNSGYVYFAEYNNGTRNYRQIAMSNIT